MDIKTKYNIGDHVWFIKKVNQKIVQVTDATIEYITIDRKGTIYCSKDKEAEEHEIVPYTNLQLLSETIVQKTKGDQNNNGNHSY